MSSAKINLQPNSEDAMNDQINAELTAAYTYASVASYFAQDSVALFGLSAYFKEASAECLDKAKKIICYMILRGAKVAFRDITAPQKWDDPETPIKTALEVEKHLYNQYLSLAKTACQNTDPQLEDFIQSVFMRSQQENIKEMADFCTNIKRVGINGVGLYMFDREVAERVDLKPAEERPLMPERRKGKK